MRIMTALALGLTLTSAQQAEIGVISRLRAALTPEQFARVL